MAKLILLVLVILQLCIKNVHLQSAVQCGIPQITKAKLIRHGYETIPGSWPWHTALYRRKHSNLDYICGGTLISKEFVVTSAHCVVADNGYQVSKGHIFIRLGIHNLLTISESLQQHEVEKIHRHANYKNHDIQHDIAVLELETEAEFNNYVQPACLGLTQDLTGHFGTVIGWGWTENDEISPTLKSTRMPVIDVLTCLLSDRAVFGETLNVGIFCAGYTNGTTVCNGDSGSGLFFQQNDAWYLGGIVSYSAILSLDNFSCNTKGYGAFTNVTNYLPWITSITGQHIEDNMQHSHDIVHSNHEQSELQILDKSSNPLYQSSQKFALNFLKHVNDLFDSDPNVTTVNIFVSPLSVWSLLALTTDGAEGKTLEELLQVLQISDQGLIRRNYKDLQNTVNAKVDGVETSSVQLMFTDKNQPVRPEFDNSIATNYGRDSHEALEFSGTQAAVKASYNRINDIVATATKDQIKKAVTPKDIAKARLVLLSVLFFQGAWTLPFNQALTTSTPFFDENEKYVANVSMMYQKAVLPFAIFRELKAQIIELPYGSDRHLSMMLILPRKVVPLKEVIGRMVNINIQIVFQILKQTAEDYEVEVYLPRFNITGDYHLNAVIHNMGVKLALQERFAEFNKIANDVFLGTVIQKSKIIVNEEGTLVNIDFANKKTRVRFIANRPFLFMIVDKRSDLILHMGQVKDPSTT